MVRRPFEGREEKKYVFAPQFPVIVVTTTPNLVNHLALSCRLLSGVKTLRAVRQKLNLDVNDSVDKQQSMVLEHPPDLVEKDAPGWVDFSNSVRLSRRVRRKTSPMGRDRNTTTKERYRHQSRIACARWCAERQGGVGDVGGGWAVAYNTGGTG